MNLVIRRLMEQKAKASAAAKHESAAPEAEKEKKPKRGKKAEGKTSS